MATYPLYRVRTIINPNDEELTTLLNTMSKEGYHLLKTVVLREQGVRDQPLAKVQYIFLHSAVDSGR